MTNGLILLHPRQPSGRLSGSNHQLHGQLLRLPLFQRKFGEKDGERNKILTYALFLFSIFQGCFFSVCREVQGPLRLSDPFCRIVVFSNDPPFSSDEIFTPDLNFFDITGIDEKAALLCQRRNDGDTSVKLFTNAALRVIFPNDGQREGPVFIVAPTSGKSYTALVAGCSAAFANKRCFSRGKLPANLAPGAIVVKPSYADVSAVQEFVEDNGWTRGGIAIRCLKAPWQNEDLVSKLLAFIIYTDKTSNFLFYTVQKKIEQSKNVYRVEVEQIEQWTSFTELI